MWTSHKPRHPLLLPDYQFQNVPNVGEKQFGTAKVDLRLFSRLSTSRLTIWACTARAGVSDRWARTCSPEWSTAVDLRPKCRWATLYDTTSRLHPRHNSWSHPRCLPSHPHPRPHRFRQTPKARARIWTSCSAWRPPTSTSTAASFSPSPSPASSWCIGSSTAIWVMTSSQIWSSWVKTRRQILENFIGKNGSLKNP